MFEKALVGSRRYWGWIILLVMVSVVGFVFYLQQLSYGLGITGMSRNVSWGLYIANFTFLVGIAASAVMVVLPYYLHNYKEFGRITALGEFLAVAAVIMCGLFIFVDLGQPARVFNMILHPSPNSLLFWDMVVLAVYLLLNVVIAWSTLDAERKSEPPPAWGKPLILISIPWAISIHTVTAFIYSGLGARPFWLTALLAPRFLASAFASGPALLIILCLIIKRFTKFDPGREALQKVAQIVTYAMIITVFFLLVELFTVFYSEIPEHMIHFQYLLFGLDGKATLVPWMWTSLILAAVALALLINPSTRRRENTLAIACVAVFASIWIDKGLGLIVPGFIPSPTGEIFEYWPTVPEALITIGVWALGFLILTILYKIAISVSEEIAA
ncbi:MAG: sulfate reduction electron transfer complex DsrMKJOP subunit DsrP [Dehalococcoidales bacterium]